MTIKTQQEAEDDLKLVNDNIEEYGCHLTLIEASNYLPGFVYSIGLFKKFKHPEIICFGLNPEVAADIINHACDLIKDGESFETGKSYSVFLEGHNIQFINVAKDHYSDYVGYAGLFYNSFDFPLLQLVWPDKQLHFPWEDNFNPDWKFKQPLLDRNTDFKFYEERNLGVFTTKQAFDGDAILYVYHDEEGDWQFHTSPEPQPGDIMMVSLEEITTLDPGLNEVFNLQFGWRAWRAGKEDKWNYEEYSDQE
jgi:hypothetical protein